MSDKFLGGRTPILLTIGAVLAVVLLVRPWDIGSQKQSPPNPPNGSSSSTNAAASRPDTTAVAEETVGQEEESPIGDFVFLFDASGSTRGGVSDPFLQGANILVPAVNALWGLRDIAPQRHRVATIGTTSLRQLPICDIKIPRPKLFLPVDKGRVSRELRECDQRLRALPVEPYTDIRGALAFAALSLRGARPALRGIVLVSDLDEDVPPGQVSALPDLHGMCVAVYTLVTTAGATHPDVLAAHEKAWRAHIKEWGADSVSVQSVLGFESQELTDFVRHCERK
jgi:hypothetical protein